MASLLLISSYAALLPQDSACTKKAITKKTSHLNHKENILLSFIKELALYVLLC